MSYSVSVTGYGYSQEILAEGTLDDALSRLDAKLLPFEFGNFIHEIAGMQYKEVDGGYFSWMLYRDDGDGGKLPLEMGVSSMVPKPGEHIYVMYEFFPSDSYDSDGYIPPPEPGRLPEESPELVYTLSDYYFLPAVDYEMEELFEYSKLVVDTELESIKFPGEEPRRPLIKYSRPNIIPPVANAAVYGARMPAPAPLRLPSIRFEDNRDLERFLMEVLAQARLEFLLPANSGGEEPPVPLIQV